MHKMTKLAVKFFVAGMAVATLLSCGQQEDKTSHSELSAQSCNYSAFGSCITELSMMSREDKGYLAKKIKCDTIFNKCHN